AVIPMRALPWLVGVSAVLAVAASASAQLCDSSFDQIDHPPLQYMTRPARDPLAQLARKNQAWGLRPAVDERSGNGYLPAAAQGAGHPSRVAGGGLLEDQHANEPDTSAEPPDALFQRIDRGRLDSRRLRCRGRGPGSRAGYDLLRA